MSGPKTCSGDQSHSHQAVFNVISCLQCVVPEVECLRDMAAKTDQQKQKRTELKNLSLHPTLWDHLQARRAETHVADPLYCHFVPEEALKAPIENFEIRPVKTEVVWGRFHSPLEIIRSFHNGNRCAGKSDAQ